MRYIQKRQQYEASNFSFKPDGQVGVSYNWWIFSCEVNGVIIFNNTTYSPSTTKHQGKGYNLLKRKPDLVLNNTRESLGNIRAALQSEIDNLEDNINSLVRAIKKPRTHKKKNEERRSSIDYNVKRIEFIVSFAKDKFDYDLDSFKIAKKVQKSVLAEKLYSNISVSTGKSIILIKNNNY